jgi:hypothetical protein
METFPVAGPMERRRPAPPWACVLLGEVVCLSADGSGRRHDVSAIRIGFLIPGPMRVDARLVRLLPFRRHAVSCYTLNMNRRHFSGFDAVNWSGLVSPAHTP